MSKFSISLLFIILFACQPEDKSPLQYFKRPMVLVTNGGDNSISILDPETFKEKYRVFIPSPKNTFLHHIGFNSDSTRFALAFPEYDFSGGHTGLHNIQKGGYVVLYDSHTEKVENTIQVPFANHNAIFSPNGTEVWTGLVSHTGRVMVYNSNNGSLNKTIYVNPDPHEIIFSKDGNYVLTTCLESSFLTVIDAKTKEILREIKVDPGPTSVWYGRTNNEVIVENSNVNSLSIVNIQDFKVTDIIDFNFKPGFSKFSPNGELWICAKGDNTVYVFAKDGEKWIQKNKVATQNDPHQLTFVNGNTWIINQKENTAEVFDSVTKDKIHTITIGLKPNSISYLP